MKKLIVVTGASSGIGMEFAKRFSAEGHPILLIARRLALMEELGLKDTLCRSVDVTDRDAMEKAIREAEAIYGKTDCLINCAGIMLYGDLTAQTYKVWEDMVDINIKGTLTGTHIVLPDMVERNEGTIINISSISGRKPFDKFSIYSATKAAIHSVSEGLRREVSGSNVRVVILSPGAVMDKYLVPSDIADCALFAYNMPQNICIRELVIATTKQTD